MMLLQTAVALLMLQNSPSSCGSTMYGYRASDINPVSMRPIGWNDNLYGGLTIWSQQHPRYTDGVAHRTLPLGSWIIVKNPLTGDWRPLRVIDRGPYGATKDGKWFSKVGAQASRAGRFSGCLDITYPAGFTINHRGRQRVEFWVVPRNSLAESELTAQYGACPDPKKTAPLWWRKAQARCVQRGRW